MSKNKYQPFSARENLEQPKPIQRGDIDEGLRNRLWNVFFKSFPLRGAGLGYAFLHPVYELIWDRFLKKTTDEYQRSERQECENIVKEAFLSSLWYQVFNFIELVLGSAIFKSPQERKNFIDLCNQVLEQENSAYRIIQGLISEITSEQEIKSIETAMETPYQGVNNHINKALSFFSDREKPDYENSIKESISAAESIITEITGQREFGAGVNSLEKHGIRLHGAHKSALKNLYGFTSDVGGIRHGSKGEDLLDINKDTALFMLITCSAFVNYIIVQKEIT